MARRTLRIALALAAGAAAVYLLAMLYLGRRDAECLRSCQAQGFAEGRFEPGSGFVRQTGAVGQAPRCACR